MPLIVIAASVRIEVTPNSPQLFNMIVEVQLNISFGCKPIGLLLLEGFLFKDFSFLLKEEGFLFKESLGTISYVSTSY